MTALALIPLLAFLNRLRGSDWGKPVTSKGAIAFACGLLYGALAFHSGLSWKPAIYGGVAVFAGFWLWAAFGWGRGFTAFHGIARILHEKEIAWIDAAADRIAGWFGVYPSLIGYDGLTEREVRLIGLIWMALRGIYALPLLVSLYPVWPYAPLLSFLTPLQGACYAAGRIKTRYGVQIGEILTGALWGSLLAITLIGGARG